MAFIKTTNPITLESECGEIFHIIPVGGAVHITTEIPDEPEPVSDWYREGGFAKPEFQRNQDWVPEDDADGKNDTAMSDWPLP